MSQTRAAVVLGLALSVVSAACSSSESRRAAEQWIGKDRADLARVMGEPKQAVPLTDTGGEMLFYSFQGHHYVFETNAGGLIASAVQTN